MRGTFIPFLGHFKLGEVRDVPLPSRFYLKIYSTPRPKERSDGAGSGRHRPEKPERSPKRP